ncbi:hypothetical protein QVD17_05978 [Tagetes erecta]|uniref:Uncharacterized protein n=1 Tax=Tagetes erecta TaxID=13708 RepID=A0AAD8LIJ9_TARER|nr:hypothetical protein QVD17_05978 [Tagetes erecta]
MRGNGGDVIISDVTPTTFEWLNLCYCLLDAFLALLLVSVLSIFQVHGFMRRESSVGSISPSLRFRHFLFAPITGNSSSSSPNGTP